MNPSPSEEKTSPNTDLLFWDWLWRLLDQLTNQPEADDLLSGDQRSKWAIGGSFSIFWWECLLGLESDIGWKDIDIYLNYGEFIEPDEKIWHVPKTVDLERTQKIANQIMAWCGGEIVAPQWAMKGYSMEPIKDRKRLTDHLELHVELKNHHSPLELDLSFKDETFFRVSEKGIYYFYLEGSFDKPLLVPVFNIDTLINIYKKFKKTRLDPQNKANDARKLIRLHLLKARLANIDLKAGTFILNPCLIPFNPRCFECNQRKKKTSQLEYARR